MIAIVSSNPHERTAFAALCEGRRWTHATCDSLRALRRLVRTARPKVVLTRHKLDDGYSDDVLALLGAMKLLPQTKLIVLIAAGTSSPHEARQVALGADCVHRDPVRTNVVAEYLARYRELTGTRTTEVAPPAESFPFARAIVHPLERTARRESKFASLTPREVALIELLFECRGQVVTYETLYAEVLQRRFRSDTSNMRVLLGKLSTTFDLIDVSLRKFVEVIPKTGYRYNQPFPQ